MLESDIHVNNPHHGQWIAERAHTHFHPDTDMVVSRGTLHEVKGGAIFTNYTRRSIVAHFAGEGRWVSRDLAWVLADYPFNQLGCERIYGFVPSWNERAIDFDKHIGCKELYRMVGAIPGGDMVILSLERADCRWLKIQPKRLSSNRTFCNGPL